MQNNNEKERGPTGCPIRDQTGADAVVDFDILISQLPPELQAALMAEIAERTAELAAYLATHAYAT